VPECAVLLIEVVPATVQPEKLPVSKPPLVTPPPPPPKPSVPPPSPPKQSTTGAPAFAFTPPAAFADIAAKVPSASNPIWRYVAFGVVGVLALGFIVSQFTGSSPTPPKPQPLLAEDANGDVAGNSHGSKPLPDDSGNTGNTGNGDGGNSDVGQGGQTGGGDSGQDVGQSR